MCKYIMKSLLILFALNIYVYASTSVTKLQYEGGISLYGKIGIADVILEENLDKNIYKITLTTYSTGLVSTLTSNRKDTFISEGTINNGVYVPNKFTKRTSKNNYDKRTTYLFDYKKNKVYKNTTLEKIEYTKEFDVQKLKIVEKQNIHKDTKKKEIDLNENDYLTMFLNVRNGNFKMGDITYLDKKNTNKVFLFNEDLAVIQKKDTKYRISTVSDDSIFFNTLISENIAFYGDGYIKKISEKTDISY